MDAVLQTDFYMILQNFFVYFVVLHKYVKSGQ